MFIDHQHKFVYVAVPKTASTTVHIYFNQANQYPTDSPPFMKKYHYSYDLILAEHPEVNDYFSFGFTRNPWDRMVSSWLEFTTEPGQLATWSQELADTFRDFRDFVLNFAKTKWAQEIHFHPAAWYLIQNRRVDFIGRYEDFAEDFAKVLVKLGKPVSDIAKLYQFRKSPRERDYHRYYVDDDMIKAVAQHFAADIAEFGYNY